MSSKGQVLNPPEPAWEPTRTHRREPGRTRPRRPGMAVVMETNPAEPTGTRERTRQNPLAAPRMAVVMETNPAEPASEPGRTHRRRPEWWLSWLQTVWLWVQSCVKTGYFGLFWVLRVLGTDRRARSFKSTRTLRVGIYSKPRAAGYAVSQV